MTGFNDNAFIENYMSHFNGSGFHIDRLKFRAEARQELQDLCGIPIEADVARHKKYAISGATVEDFRERIVQIDESRSVLTGIRFISGNRSLPFIAAWPTYGLESIECVQSLARFLVPLYKLFLPKFIQVYSPSGSALEESLEDAVPPRRRLYVGEVSAIVNRSRKVPPVSGFHVVKSASLAFYDRYLELYKDLHKAANSQDLKNKPNDKEDLDEAFSEGLLWEIVLNGELIGMLQAEEGMVFGERSLYVSDIVVQRSHRGRGFGPLAQLELLRGIGEPYRYLFGEIIEANTASISAAQKLNRLPVRSEFLVPLNLLHTASFPLDCMKE